MQLHNLKARKLKPRKRVGRGDSSGHGTYSTRGLKGQRSRSGGKSGLRARSLKMTMMSLPKFKGMKSYKPNSQPLNLFDLEKNFKENDIINPDALLKKKLISSKRAPVKILSKGELTKKLTIEDCLLSAVAEEKIKKAGGVIKGEEAPVEEKKEEKNKGPLGSASGQE